MRTRIKKQPAYKKHLNRWRVYLGAIIIVWVLIYIIILGTISFAKQLFSIQVYAPTHKVYAAVVTPTPTPPTLNPDLTEREQNIELIQKIWGKDQVIGLAIARCESGYSTKGPHVANTNNTIDQGVFSINSVHNMPEMDTAVANISTAYLMFKAQGTTPWDSSKHCWEGQI